MEERQPCISMLLMRCGAAQPGDGGVGGGGGAGPLKTEMMEEEEERKERGAALPLTARRRELRLCGEQRGEGGREGGCR